MTYFIFRNDHYKGYFSTAVCLKGQSSYMGSFGLKMKRLFQNDVMQLFTQKTLWCV